MLCLRGVACILIDGRPSSLMVVLLIRSQLLVLDIVLLVVLLVQRTMEVSHRRIREVVDT